jgi:hypothetical protein
MLKLLLRAELRLKQLKMQSDVPAKQLELIVRWMAIRELLQLASI